jgi:DNA repair protein RecO (recombination protein O)
MRDRLYRTEALILRRRDFQEADRLLVLATPAGKRHVIAKGVRKTTSRLAGHIELFTHSSMQLAIGRNLHIITQSQMRHSFSSLHSDLARLGAAYYVADLYDTFTQHEEENPPLFQLMLQTFFALDATHAPDVLLRAYELRLLHLMGYRPHLHRCAVCHTMLTEEASRLSPTHGGVLCPDHADHDRTAQAMSLSAFKLLRYLQNQPFAAIERLNISAATSSEAERILRAYLQHLLERDLKSLTFLESLRPPDQPPDQPWRLHNLHE